MFFSSKNAEKVIFEKVLEFFRRFPYLWISVDSAIRAINEKNNETSKGAEVDVY